MLETITLLLFLGGLLVCVATGIEILYALILGLCCFWIYCVAKKNTVVQILSMMWEGVKSAKTVIIVLALIGVLTAVWRAGGTVAFIIYNAINLINPDYFVISTFLLCCLMSVLTGTAFGTAGTMGIVCMTISQSLGIDSLLMGGAILSGIFFGDRCSPMSSSAMLICSLTDTNIYKNIAKMVKTSIIPFVITCIFYIIAGNVNITEPVNQSSVEAFAEHFNLYLITVLPALLIIVLSLLRVSVTTTIMLSILSGCFVCVTVQHISLMSLFEYLINGYSVAGNIQLSQLIGGGGLFSMLRSVSIIIISSSYFGIFRHTELLSKAKHLVQSLTRTITPFGTTFVTAIVMSAISCNQVLAAMLTCQMNEEIIPDREELAIALENTAILIPALIPWSIASAVPIAMIGAPIGSILSAVYIYLVPICNFLWELICSKVKKEELQVDI